MRRRFGILTFPAGQYDETSRLWRELEEMGFDSAWVPDVLTYPGLVDYDSCTLLGALARETTRIRIGTLVTQIIYRHPLLLAAAAITIDRVSDGRLELGVGAGAARVDSDAVGATHWSLPERMERFGEQLAMLDRLLRGERLSYAGSYYRTEAEPLATPVQRPRPPLMVAAQLKGSLRHAARYADAWNSLGGQPQSATGRPTVPIDEAVAATREQVGLLDGYCREVGRDPGAIRRSVLAFRAEPVPLTSLDAFDEFVGRYAEIGFEEFIFYWPPIANIRQREPLSAAQRRTLESIASARVIRSPA